MAAVAIALVPLGVTQYFDNDAANRATSQEVRTQKAPIYKEMVEASNQYGRAQAVKYQCKQDSATVCDVSDQELEQARLRFENANGAVFMFGSAEAMTRVSQMRTAGLNPNLLPDGKPSVGLVDLNLLRKANLDFEKAVCKESRIDGCETR